MTAYDVIAIGSGIGGLTAAALLAKSGRKVLVLEAHDRPGGYAHGFKRKKYSFDSGVHLISGCGPYGYKGGQVIHKTLSCLDVLHEIDFIKVDPFCHTRYPAMHVPLFQHLETFVDRLSEHFPQQRNGLTELVSLCLQISEEITIAEEVLPQLEYESAKKLMPALFKYRKSTLQDVMAKYIDDSRLQSIFSSNWPYLGLPPAKVSFVYWSTMLIGYMVDGAYYCKGGFQSLADSLVSGLKKYGGEIQYKTSVSKILVSEDNVDGVMTEKGSYLAPVVISNADMHQTIHQLVGKEFFPERFLQRIEKMTLSLSIFTVYIATDLDLSGMDNGHEMFCYTDFDHEKNFAETLQGNITWLSITAPTLVDPKLAPSGENLLLLTTLLPYQAVDSWKQEKSRYLELMLTLADRFLPGLKQHILFVEAGSPATMRRYCRNKSGAAYGWNVSPNQIGPLRIDNQSPLSGLFFAGHWSSPGGGIYGVSVSGMQTAQKVMGIQHSSDFWKQLSLRE